jgi:hypothetical protein
MRDIPEFLFVLVASEVATEREMLGIHSNAEFLFILVASRVATSILLLVASGVATEREMFWNPC